MTSSFILSQGCFSSFRISQLQDAVFTAYLMLKCLLYRYFCKESFWCRPGFLKFLISFSCSDSQHINMWHVQPHWWFNSKSGSADKLSYYQYTVVGFYSAPFVVRQQSAWYCDILPVSFDPRDVTLRRLGAAAAGGARPRRPWVSQGLCTDSVVTKETNTLDVGVVNSEKKRTITIVNDVVVGRKHPEDGHDDNCSPSPEQEMATQTETGRAPPAAAPP